MCLFLFRKGKEVVNIMFKIVTHFLRGFCSINSVCMAKRIRNYVFAVCVILQPCLVEGGTICNERLELFNGGLYFGESRAESAINISRPINGKGIQADKFVNDGTSEGGSGLVKSGFSVCCICQMEPNPGQRQSSGNSEKPNISCSECKSK